MWTFTRWARSSTRSLTGRPPYRAATPPQIIHAILSEEVVAPSTRLPGIPRNLEAICLKCLEKDPKDRYATAADLAEGVRRFLDGRVTAARPASRASVVSDGAGETRGRLRSWWRWGSV